METTYLKFGTLLKMITYCSRKKVGYSTENGVMKENEILELSYLIHDFHHFSMQGNETGSLKSEYPEEKRNIFLKSHSRFSKENFKSFGFAKFSRINY